MAGPETEWADCMRPPSESNADLFLILESSARRIARFQFLCGERAQHSALLYFFARPHLRWA
jgi:hypothetical protein